MENTYENRGLHPIFYSNASFFSPRIYAQLGYKRFKIRNVEKRLKTNS